MFSGGTYGKCEVMKDTTVGIKSYAGIAAEGIGSKALLMAMNYHVNTSNSALWDYMPMVFHI